MNTLLSDQLKEATNVNAQLQRDIEKMSSEWQRQKTELENMESEWREEERAFNEYFSNEHARLLTLWRAVVAFRRSFSELKSSTEKYAHLLILL